MTFNYSVLTSLHKFLCSFKTFLEFFFRVLWEFKSHCITTSNH